MTEQEKAYARLDLQYKEKFGSFYPVEFGDNRSSAEHMEIIRNCLKLGNPHVIPDRKIPKGVMV